MKTTPFINVMQKSILSALVGIFAGFFLGCIIWGMSQLASYLNHFIYQTEYSSYGGMFGPEGLVGLTFLGMCFGAIIGAIHGGAFAVNENKKTKK